MGAPTHASACFHQESARNLLQYCFIWAAAYIRECVAGMGFWEWARRSLLTPVTHAGFKAVLLCMESGTFPYTQGRQRCRSDAALGASQHLRLEHVAG